MNVIEVNVITGKQTVRDMTQEEIAAALVVAESEVKPTYRSLRAEKYPPIGDQLDEIMKWLATETEFNVPAELKSIAMTCMSVKAQYPKPQTEE